MNCQIDNVGGRDLMLVYRDGNVVLGAILHYDKEVCRVGDNILPLQWARNIWGEGCPF